MSVPKSPVSPMMCILVVGMLIIGGIAFGIVPNPLDMLDNSSGGDTTPPDTDYDPETETYVISMIVYMSDPDWADIVIGPIDLWFDVYIAADLIETIEVGEEANQYTGTYEYIVGQEVTIKSSGDNGNDVSWIVFAPTELLDEPDPTQAPIPTLTVNDGGVFHFYDMTNQWDYGRLSVWWV